MNFNQLTFLIKLSLISFGVLVLAVGIPFTRNGWMARSNLNQVATTSALTAGLKNAGATAKESVSVQPTGAEVAGKKTKLGKQMSDAEVAADAAKPVNSQTNSPAPVSDSVPAPTDVPAAPAAPEPTSPPDLFSQLGSHSSQSDCWVTYKNHLYDITPYFGQHPGGSAVIALFCGRAMDLAYDTKNFIPGKAHTSRADELLQSYLIQ